MENSNKWIYFKIYCEQTISDNLIKKISQLNHLLKGKWFFIRYFDFGYHIRLRVNIDSNNNNMTNKDWLHYLDFELKEFRCSIYQKEYEPEYDRYGYGDELNLVESIFCISSANYADFLKREKLGIENKILSVLSSLDVMSSVFKKCSPNKKFNIKLVDNDEISKYLNVPQEILNKSLSCLPQIHNSLKKFASEMESSGMVHESKILCKFRKQLVDLLYFSDQKVVLKVLSDSMVYSSLVHLHFNRYGFSRHKECLLRKIDFRPSYSKMLF